MSDEKKAVKARVISRCGIGGERYEPNELVIFPAEIAGEAEEIGVLDSSDAAVRYCESQDVKSFVHGKRPEVKKKSKKSKK